MNVQVSSKKSDEYVDSDESDGEDNEIDPKIKGLSTHQLMERMYMKVSKIENTRLPKMKKTIKNIEANQIEINEKIEEMEEKIHDNKINNDKNEKKIEELDNEVKQMKRNQTKNENEIKALTEEVDRHAAEQEDHKSKLRNMELRFRAEMDKKIAQIQKEIGEMNKDKILGPIQPAGRSINEELAEAQGTSRPVNIAPAWQRIAASPALAAAIHRPPQTAANPQIAASSQRGTQIAAKSNNLRYKPIKIQTKEEIIKEAATTIGIMGVSDMTIRKFSTDKNRMRYPKSTVWKGEEFVGARNLFVKFFLVKYLKFYESEIRFSDVRFCREPEKGILWLKSDCGFIKGMHIRAAELQNDQIKLINFTPQGAYRRYQGMIEICKKIRAQDPEYIRAQIRPAKDDFEIFIKKLREGPSARYIRHKVEEFDPKKELPEIELKVMESDEVKMYMEAATQAIEDAQREAEGNSEEGTPNLEEIEIDEVPFIETRNKRKGSPKEKESKVRRDENYENSEGVIGIVHENMGIEETKNSEEGASENDDTLE